MAVKNLTSVFKQNCHITTYGQGKIYMLCQTKPILGVQYSHLWPLEKFVQSKYYVCILATYGPVKNLTCVLKTKCNIATYISKGKNLHALSN